LTRVTVGDTRVTPGTRALAHSRACKQKSKVTDTTTLEESSITL